MPSHGPTSIHGVTKGYARAPCGLIFCPPEGKEDERRYVFRMVTRSHPWGYERNSPQKKLQRRCYSDALECFAKVSRRQKDATWKPGKLDIRVAFPWDSK